MNEQIKQKITEALRIERQESNISTDARFARSLGIMQADFHHIVEGKWIKHPELISKSMWNNVAEAIKFQPTPKRQWETAQTKAYRYLTQQFDACRDMGTTKLFVDIPGIGKTHAGEEYERRNPEQAFYINCSHAPNKIAFINYLAAKLELEEECTVEKTFKACIHYINTFIEKPILILDEGGDVEHSVILLLKRLYNVTEYHLAMYMCGSHGFEKKLTSGIKLRKNGYAEFASRMGGELSQISDVKDVKNPKDAAAIKAEYIRKEAEIMCAANSFSDMLTVNEIVNKGGDLRHVARKIRISRWKEKRNRKSIAA